ncbi:MAG: TonB-dependent receptor [Lacunisphaera sp.]
MNAAHLDASSPAAAPRRFSRRAVSPRPSFARFLPLCVVLLLGAGAASAATESAKKTFDVPAGEATRTLKVFSEQSGEQIVYPVEQVRGVKTKAVRGELNAREALAAMLADTRLVVVQDERTGALAVKRADSPAEEKNGSSRHADALAAGATGAATTATTGASDMAKPVSDFSGQMAKPTEGSISARRVGSDTAMIVGTVTFEKYEVTGSRIPGLAGEATAQPVFSLSAADIERTGVSSVGDLFGYIPQLSGIATGVAVADSKYVVSLSGGAQITGVPQINGQSPRVTAGLRGASNGGTLILIDGKRAPKTGQLDGNDGYDVGGVPVSAIERIDVLPSGASAIYGADAMGGVINIILKKDHQGTTVRLGYENTFDTDAAQRTVEVSHFFTRGKWSGRLTASWQDAAALALADRDFAASMDRRPFGGADLRGDPTQFGVPVAGTGKITGLYALLGLPLPIPGLTTQVAPIPAGSTGHPTVADYQAAGTALQPFDLAQYSLYNSPFRRRSLGGNLEYRHARWLTLSADYRWSGNDLSLTLPPIQAASLLLPAGAPGNPFSQPVFLQKYFFDLPRPVQTIKSETAYAAFGARGQFFDTWRYDASISTTRSLSSGSASMGSSLSVPDSAWSGPNPPLLAYDGATGQSPNPPGTIEALTDPGPLSSAEQTQEWVYSLSAAGSIWNLPAGDLQAAVGVEYREDYVDFPLLTPDDPNAQYEAQAGNTHTSSVYAELRVPLLGGRWARPGVEEFTATLAGRYDRYPGYEGHTNPTYGLVYRPVKWLTLRASRAEGYKVPTLKEHTQPNYISQQYLDPSYPIYDPRRGNQPLDGLYDVLMGGNPDLQPERSKSTTAGLVVDLPFIKGLSLTFDWYRDDYINRIEQVDFQTVFNVFPDRIARGANLPDDPAGWAGPVTQIDDRPVNVAFNRVAGYDLGANYTLMAAGGQIDFRANMTVTTKNEFHALPDSPPDPTITTDSTPTQLSGSVFWTRNPWGMGVLFTYQGPHRYDPSVAMTPSATRWDWQGSYNFNKARWLNASSDRTRRLLKDTRVSVTIFNVFNTRPPFNFNYLPDNGVLDTRLRRYALSLTREF